MTNIGSPSSEENPASPARAGARVDVPRLPPALQRVHNRHGAFLRAEVQRANVWRSRLDATTNWAVIATGAALTIAFNQSSHHGVILLNTLLVTLFLYIEARRYRYYELWSSRIRLMETDFYAAMLVPPFQPAPDWAESLAENLLQPHFPSRCGRQS